VTLSLALDFIIGLEKDYPSTVSTIARTCNKLTTKEESSTICLFCERCVLFLHLRSGVSFLDSPIQSGIQEWKHSISIRSYREVHTQDELPSRVHPPSEVPDSQNPSDTHTVTSRICYTCHTSWTSRSIRGYTDKENEVPVPVWASSHLADEDARARRKLEPEDMKNLIGDLIIGP
jgi:cytoplasmic tRNA 2-thiolation protein 2